MGADNGGNGAHAKGRETKGGSSMDGRAKQWMAEHGIACMGRGQTIDSERYLELDHRIPRSDATNRPVRSRGPIHLEMTDELAGRALRLLGAA